MQRYRRTSFRFWWAGIRKHAKSDRRRIITNWLKLAAVTVALRGDQDQQRVVYAIRKRDMNSQYPLSKQNAKRVFQIVNAKMNMHRNQQQQKPRHKQRKQPEVQIIRRRTTKTVASRGRNANT